MSLLPPSSSWAARQPGKALVRPPAQAPRLAGRPGVTTTAHPAVSAHCQAGVHLAPSWELSRAPCFSGGPVLVCVSCFWKVPG